MHAGCGTAWAWWASSATLSKVEYDGYVIRSLLSTRLYFKTKYDRSREHQEADAEMPKMIE